MCNSHPAKTKVTESIVSILRRQLLLMGLFGMVLVLNFYHVKEETIAVKMDSERIAMNMTEYLTGVILAEMPTSFEDEAIKAQAVAAGTYARKTKGSAKHNDCDICADGACCQGFYSKEDYLKAGGREAEYNRIMNLVKQVSNQVITYDGMLIEATYFSCSGGRTEDAVAVWGNEYPYLIAKESPGEERATNFESEFYFTKEEIKQKLGLAEQESYIPSAVFLTDGKGIASVCFGETKVSGVELRRKLGLPSTMLSLVPDESGLKIIAKGSGHRVGLSQYGANAMAENGVDFKAILQYYYPGGEVSEYKKR